MATLDDPETNSAPHDTALAAEPEPEAVGSASRTARRVRLPNQAKLAARLHKVRLTAPKETTVALTESDENAELEKTPAPDTLKSQRKVKQDPLAEWQNWSKFRLWRHTRPLWGSILMIIGAAALLAFPLSLLQFAFLLNTFWASLLIGGLLLVMGVIQLFLPNYAVITGSIGIVLSLVSFITNTFGACGIGMLLGIIGCALSIAWRPVRPSRLLAASR